MVEGLASAAKINPPRRSRSTARTSTSRRTPDDLVAKIKEIVGDVPGLMTTPAAPTPAAPPGAP